MQLRALLFGISLSILGTLPAHADEMKTLKRLADIVAAQCKRHYDIDTQAPIESLQQKKISAVDKLACAYPYAFNKVQVRLAELEKLDPAGEWGAKTYQTLAARIYNFDYLMNTPNGDIKTEIISLHPDLLMLHRILRQTTPYALSFAYPRLTSADRDLPQSARKAAAGASEITPWSMLLREAKGMDCYGPEQKQCSKNRSAALQQLLQAVQLLEKNENLYHYVAEYSQTREAAQTDSAFALRISADIRKSLSGTPVDYILGQRTGLDGWSVRPDLRDSLSYLAVSDQDVETAVLRVINLRDLDCRLVFSSLYALSSESKNSGIRQAFVPFNPFETLVVANPALKSDVLQLQSAIDKMGCQNLPELSHQLKLRGLLSRFQVYQTRAILISSHDDALPAETLKKSSRHFSLVSDVEQVIQEAKALAKKSGIQIQPTTSKVPEQLVDYLIHLVKEEGQ